MFKKYKPLLIKISIVLIAVAIVLVYLYVNPIKSVVNLVLISFIISYSIKPLRDWICEKINISRRVASLIIILMTITIFGMLIYFIIPTVINESKNFGAMLDNLEKYFMEIVNKLNLQDTSIFETAYLQINEKVNIFLKNIADNLIDNILAIMENLIGLAIIPVVSYYLLADGELLYNKLLLIFPTEKRVIVRKINSNIDKVLSRYIISQLILSLIIGVLTLVMMILLRIKFPLVLSFFNALVNIIPYFGPLIGGVPIVFIALLQSPSKAVFALIAAYLIQQIEGDLLAPKITGDSTNLHPIIIIILLVLGEKVGGLVGMVLAVPIVVIIKVIYDDINYYLF